jgi:peptidyl-prolyl cis-trans isomerase B (cyclophilin B)
VVAVALADGAVAADDEAKQDDPAAAGGKPRVVLVTSLGDITLELNDEKAPGTVKNFLRYVDDKFYDGLIFHRVIEGFMVQGGGFTPDIKKKDTRDPIQNEADNGLKNDRGTIAMARTPDPHSATAQFFINVVNNNALNHTEKSDRGWGYCVFGKVVEGMETVDKIRRVKTQTLPNGLRDVPVEPVVIVKARRVEAKESGARSQGSD